MSLPPIQASAQVIYIHAHPVLVSIAWPAPSSVQKKKYIRCVCIPCVSYSLVVIAVKRVHPARKGSELLGLDLLLATTNAADTLLDRASYAAASRVAAPNARGFGVGRVSWHTARSIVAIKGPATRLHLGTRLAGGLVFLESSFDGERRLALAFEIVWMVLLHTVSVIAIVTT